MLLMATKGRLGVVADIKQAQAFGYEVKRSVQHKDS